MLVCGCVYWLVCIVVVVVNLLEFVEGLCEVVDGDVFYDVVVGYGD